MRNSIQYLYKYFVLFYKRQVEFGTFNQFNQNILSDLIFGMSVSVLLAHLYPYAIHRYRTAKDLHNKYMK